MNNKTQLLKGCLEGCVLKIIEIKGEIYGYDILKILRQNGFTSVTEGTLYPLYNRLQKKGIIKAISKKSPLGPARKYYSLTSKGYDDLNEFCESWMYLSKKVDNIVKEELT